MIIGWVVTYDHLNSGDLEIPSRVGWGQVSESDVYADADSWPLRTITMATDLDPELILYPIRFRLADEDGVDHYAGVISLQWLNGDEALAFSPLRWGENDTGATIMLYEKDGRWEHL